MYLREDELYKSFYETVKDIILGTGDEPNADVAELRAIVAKTYGATLQVFKALESKKEGKDE